MKAKHKRTHRRREGVSNRALRRANIALFDDEPVVRKVEPCPDCR